MNKRDLIFLVIMIFFILIFLFFNKNEYASTAKVFYKNNIVLTINLDSDSIYEVDGELGKVIIEVNNKRIRVLSETSPNNICSKQGYISNSNQSLVCLPNNIVIKLTDETEIDAVVR